MPTCVLRLWQWSTASSPSRHCFTRSCMPWWRTSTIEFKTYLTVWHQMRLPWCWVAVVNMDVFCRVFQPACLHSTVIIMDSHWRLVVATVSRLSMQGEVCPFVWTDGWLVQMECAETTFRWWWFVCTKCNGWSWVCSLLWELNDRFWNLFCTSLFCSFSPNVFFFFTRR